MVELACSAADRVLNEGVKLQLPIVALAAPQGESGEACWPRRCIAGAQRHPESVSSLPRVDSHSRSTTSRAPPHPSYRPGQRTVVFRDIAGPGPRLLVQLVVLGADLSSQCQWRGHWPDVSFLGPPGALFPWPQRHYLPPAVRRWGRRSLWS